MLEIISVVIAAIGVGFGIYTHARMERAANAATAEQERLRTERDAARERVGELEDDSARRAAFDDLRNLMAETHRWADECFRHRRYCKPGPGGFGLTDRFIQLMLTIAKTIAKIAFPARAANLRAGLAAAAKGNFLMGNELGTWLNKTERELAALAVVVEALTIADLANGVDRSSLPGWTHEGDPLGTGRWPELKE